MPPVVGRPARWKTPSGAALVCALLSSGPSDGSCDHEAQVLSMLCSADFSDDWSVRPQLYFTVIHILL